jgi:hypothetical protein
MHQPLLGPNVDHAPPRGRKHGFTPIVDAAGTPTHILRGLNRRAFQARAFFHSFSELPWWKFLGATVAAHVSVVSFFAVVYYCLCLACGAHVNVVLAFYVAIVTLPGNGGYEGEDAKVLSPHNSCFTLRTLMIEVESWFNVIFAASVAAVCVAKVIRASALRHRILFTDSLVRVPGQWEDAGRRCTRYTFRVAHAHTRPLIGANLKVYAIAGRQAGADEHRHHPHHGASPPRAHGRPMSPGETVVHTMELTYRCAEESHVVDVEMP